MLSKKNLGLFLEWTVGANLLTLALLAATAWGQQPQQPVGRRPIVGTGQGTNQNFVKQPAAQTANPNAQNLGQPNRTNPVNAQTAQNPVGQPVNQTNAITNGNNGQTVPVVSVDQAVTGGVAQVVSPPIPELTPHEQQFLDATLDLWEKQTSKINTFECKFKRYVFNPTVHATNPELIAQGFIRYKNPDKGVFKEELTEILEGDKQDGSPDYRRYENRPGDWWVCDGEWVHHLDRSEKKAIRTQLPPELRGNNIPLSPLPFLFGVKANEVKARYYLRPLVPPKGNNDVWIEAWPKRADDAGNYSRVQIALDRRDWLPNAMILFLPQWSPASQHREVFNFNEREVNSNNLLDKLKENLFMKAFIETNVGNDWNVIREPWIPPQQQQSMQPGQPMQPSQLGQPVQPGSQPMPPGQTAPGLQPIGNRVAAPPQTAAPKR